MSAAVGLAPEIARIAENTTDWWKANQNLVKTNVAQYAERIKVALEKIWGVIQYDPAILEWGLVGLAIGGKKWGVIAGSMGHLATWSSNLAKALGLASQGILEYSEIAKANFAELDELVKKGEARLGASTGKIGPRTKGWEIYAPAVPKPPPPPVMDTAGADAAKKKYDALMKEVAKAQAEFQESLVVPSGTAETMEQQLRVDIGRHVTGFDRTKEDIENTKRAFEDMYSDLGFQAEGYYEYRKALLEKQAGEYEDYTGDTVLAHQWLTEQIKALDQDRLEAARKNNLFLIELSERTAEAIEDNFSTFFRDVFRGELDSAADYFRAFCHSLTDSFSDMLGQMTKEMLFGGGASGGRGFFGSLFSGFGNLFSGGTSLDASAGLGADWAGTLWHKGGTVGRDAAPVRYVPESLFAGAPRLHKGLAPDEFPAILQRGEVVIPRNQAVSNYGSTVKNTSISVPVTIDSIEDRRLSARLQSEIERKIQDILREEMR